MVTLTELRADRIEFPAPQQALDDPNGLLAVGGDLSVARLREAYRQGIFPWFAEADPLLWWSPDPRAIIVPDELHISRSLRKFAKRSGYQCTINHAFDEVIEACAQTRAEHEGTWITDDMVDAYKRLHLAGDAHSVEVWWQGKLVGGLYGVVNGAVFCGESMFHRANNASKIALWALCQQLVPAGMALIDCQMPTEHLESLGARTITREAFLATLKRLSTGKISREALEPQSISGICG